MRRLSTSTRARRRRSRWACCRSSLLLFAVRDRLAPAAGREPGRQAAACARQRSPDTMHSYAFEEDTRSGACCSGRTPGRACKRIGIGAASSARRSASLFGVAIGVVPRVRALLSPLLVARAVDDSAARDPADPVHRAGPGRSREDRADRDRHRARASCAIWRCASASCPRSSSSRRRRWALRPGS